MEGVTRLVITKDGPCIVHGKVPLSLQIIIPNEEGFSWDWEEGGLFDTESECKLCRCGQSKNQPFCDDVCKTVKFDGKETASREPIINDARLYDGPTLSLQDTESLCAHARFCMAAGKIWNLVKESDEPTARELAIREANRCPSGRLVLQDTQTRKEIEHHTEPSIGLVEDPARGCSGPLWVRGGIRIESEDGTPYESRGRVTLCRCGASENKPFCNGSHKRIKFKDGLVRFEADH